MKRQHLWTFVMYGVCILIGLTGCQKESSDPVYPGNTDDMLNYYMDKGEIEGLINGALFETEGVLSLPAGTWRVRYLSDEQWWQIVVRSQYQACHYIGTFQVIKDVVIRMGTHPSTQEQGLLETVSVTESAWQPLDGSEDIWVFRNGELAPGITPMDRQDFCPLAENQPIIPTPTPAICNGTPWEGFCWYLSALKTDCETTCRNAGLTVNTNVDSATENFWDVHTAEQCRELLVLTGHPKTDSTIGPLDKNIGYGYCSAANDSGIVFKAWGGLLSVGVNLDGGQIACPCR